MPDENDTQSEFAQIKRSDLQALRAIEKSHKELQAELTNLQREVTISKAGLTDLGDIQRKALLAVLGDDPLTPEVVQETAKALGFVQPPPAAPNPQDNMVQQYQQQLTPNPATNPLADPLAQYRQATNTAPSTGTAPPRDFAAEIASADSPEAVMALARQLGVDAHYD